MSMIAKLTLRAGQLLDVALLPVFINSNAQPEITPPDDARFEQIRAYLAEISASAGLASRFARRGDEIVVTSA